MKTIVEIEAEMWYTIGYRYEKEIYVEKPGKEQLRLSI